MSFIDIHQSQAPVLNDAKQEIGYRVKTEILRSVGIDTNLFVYGVATQEFLHVASLYDLKKWPSSIDLAREAQLDFYRVNSVDKTYLSNATASEAALYFIKRLELVVNDWDHQTILDAKDIYLTIKGKT